MELLSLLDSESAPNFTIRFLHLIPTLILSPHFPNLCTFPMRRWSRNSASFLHSSQALSSSAVGKEIPDTLCRVSGAPEDFHKDDEFCGRTSGVKGKMDRADDTQPLMQTSNDTLGVGLTRYALFFPPSTPAGWSSRPLCDVYSLGGA